MSRSVSFSNIDALRICLIKCRAADSFRFKIERCHAADSCLLEMAIKKPWGLTPQWLTFLKQPEQQEDEAIEDE
uniref:Uncharacterized protein n=1 Tax=Ditylenchus dipsaci TaxID=166011 RepID=A0A915E9R7_9BILA